MSSTRALRSRLFRSHLAVMVIAVLVMAVLGGILAAALFEVGLIGDGGGSGKSRDAGATPLIAFVIIVFSAISAAALVARYVARRIVGPVTELGEATRLLAQGNYAVKVPRSNATELAQLADDVAGLAEQLRTTEERRLRLIDDLAHELRTPLTTIEGSMEGLMDGVLEPSDEVFASVAKESARLKRLAFDLSALSRAQEGAYAVELSRLDLRAVARDVAERLRHQFDAKGVSLAVEPGEPVWVDADPDRLAQILTNVIGNALVCTDGAGSVTVRTTSEANQAVLRVTDTGRGLAVDDVERIFERFYRVDPRTGSGTGVGLTIARQLARAHGGELAATSAGLGQGATLVLTLPAPGTS